MVLKVDMECISKKGVPKNELFLKRASCRGADYRRKQGGHSFFGQTNYVYS